MSQQKEIHCHACNARIIFNPLVKSASGKMIPLEYLTPDKKHDCPARKQQAATTPQAQPQTRAYDERQDQIQRNFEARLKFDQEKFEFDKAMFAQNQALIAQVVDVAHQIEIAVKTMIEAKDLFKTALQLHEAKA